METPRSIRSLLYILFGVCPLLFFTDLTRNPYYTQIALLNILIPACWVLWLAQACHGRELVWVRSGFDLPLLTLIGISLLSWLASLWAHPHFISSIYSEGSKAAVFLVVNTTLVYAAALRVRDKSLVRSLLWITYAVSFIASLYGVIQSFGIELIWPSQLNPYGSRPVSTFGNPNFMSSYLVVALPLMVADYLYKATRCPRSILFIAIQMSLAALLATLTRSSWAGLALGLAVVLWGVRRGAEGPIKGKTILWVTMLLLVIAWPQSGPGHRPAVIERLLEVKKVTQETYGSAYQRFLIWLSAWGMVQDHPFLGKGWGCIELFYPFYQGPLLLEKNLNLRTHANNAHNEILEYWSQIGTIGLGIVLWMWTFFFRFCALLSRRLTGAPKAVLWGLA